MEVFMQALSQGPIRAKDNVFHDVLDRVRTLVKKYSHSVNAKAELYELVQLLVVCYVVTCWCTARTWT